MNESSKIQAQILEALEIITSVKKSQDCIDSKVDNKIKTVFQELQRV